MNTKTDPAAPRKPAAESTPATAGRPRLALAIATAGGLGYLKPGPGTWGSLLGLVLTWLALVTSTWRFDTPPANGSWAIANLHLNFLWAQTGLIIVLSFVGVWAAGRVETYLGRTDPQIVVIDEVSGQMIAFLALSTRRSFGLNWKYFLLGFILFRVFDIWKPFPVRQVEKLPGGWGIMADDWLAAIYAAIGLWIARALGL